MALTYPRHESHPSHISAALSRALFDREGSRADIFPDERDHGVGRAARTEDLLHAERLHRGDVAPRDHAAEEHEHVVLADLPEPGRDLARDGEVALDRARDADHVDVLLDRGVEDLPGL